MRSAAIALAVLAAGCATTAGPMTGGELGAAVRAGRVSMESYDFAAAGFFAMSGDQRVAYSAELEHALHPNGTPQTCRPEEVRTSSASGWHLLAEQAPDEAAWRTNAEALRATLAGVDARLAAAAADNADPRLRELFLRTTRDQIARNAVTSDAGALPPDLPPFMWNMAVTSRVVAIDCDNTAWLRGQLAEIGWFDIATYGPEADGAAWLLVQHADRAPDFQREVLARLEALPQGRTNPSNLALLGDRVAVAEGRLQVYGTQGACEDGAWAPRPVENPDHLDERRAALGLPPEAAYIAMIAQLGLCAHH